MLANPQSSTDRLALLLRLSQTFNSTLNLSEVLDRVMDEIIAATRAERGFVMLHENDGRLAFRTARGIDQSTIEQPQFQISLSVVEGVARTGEPVLTSDAQSDSRFSGHHSVMLLGLRAIMCAPLKAKDKVLGVVYVDNRFQAGIFRPDDLDLLSAIASLGVIAVDNARLYQIAVDNARLEYELRLARQMQANLLPQQIPHLSGWQFAARWLPAREVAGDYYDFISRDDGCLGVLVADVTDKGMPAALFMAFTRTILRASMDRALSPREGMLHANHLICTDSTNGFFVTLFYAQVDPATGELLYVNAGHNPPLLYQSSQPGQLLRLYRTGLPLGIDTEHDYRQEKVVLHSGDLIVFYTDGVTDALDAQEREFGMERLQQVVQANLTASAAQIANAIEQQIKDFAGDIAPFDDITIVVAKRK